MLADDNSQWHTDDASNRSPLESFLLGHYTGQRRTLQVIAFTRKGNARLESLCLYIPFLVMCLSRWARFEAQRIILQCGLARTVLEPLDEPTLNYIPGATENAFNWILRRFLRETQYEWPSWMGPRPSFREYAPRRQEASA